MERLAYSWSDVRKRAELMLDRMEKDLGQLDGLEVWPVPRGGIFVAMLLTEVAAWRRVFIKVVEEEGKGQVIVDDVVDSGRTMARYGDRPFYALVDKRAEGLEGVWIEFPWERMVGESGIEDNVRRILEYIGEDPSRDGLRETPKRVAKSYAEMLNGYDEDPDEVIKTFENVGYDEIVLVRNVEFFSVCEHHLLPFYGVAHIGYLPNGRIVGLSKLVRLLEVYSRRLQVQERICVQVTEELDRVLKPKGSACILVGKHLCMMCRGVEKQGSEVVTSSLTGVFLKDISARSELFSLVGL